MKRILMLRQIAEDLRAGLTDEQLMSKYNLSADALKDLLARFARAYALGSGEIEVDD